MIVTNEQLKTIYFGAYKFKETDDGYLQAFQYSEKQDPEIDGTFRFNSVHEAEALLLGFRKRCVRAP